MERNKLIIVALIIVILVLLLGIALSISNFTNNDSKQEINDNVATNEVTTASSDSPHSITVVPEFDKDVRKTVGEYTVEATKWRGSSIGGFGVSLYKNNQLMDRYSYETRAYFCMNGEWKWSEWDYGEVDAVYHKYDVSNDVDIQQIEVRF